MSATPRTAAKRTVSPLLTIRPKASGRARVLLIDRKGAASETLLGHLDCPSATVATLEAWAAEMGWPVERESESWVVEPT